MLCVAAAWLSSRVLCPDDNVLTINFVFHVLFSFFHSCCCFFSSLSNLFLDPNLFVFLIFIPHTRLVPFLPYLAVFCLSFICWFLFLLTAFSCLLFLFLSSTIGPEQRRLKVCFFYFTNIHSYWSLGLNTPLTPSLFSQCLTLIKWSWMKTTLVPEGCRTSGGNKSHTSGFEVLIKFAQMSQGSKCDLVSRGTVRLHFWCHSACFVSLLFAGCWIWVKLKTSVSSSWSYCLMCLFGWLCVVLQRLQRGGAGRILHEEICKVFRGRAVSNFVLSLNKIYCAGVMFWFVLLELMFNIIFKPVSQNRMRLELIKWTLLWPWLESLPLKTQITKLVLFFFLLRCAVILEGLRNFLMTSPSSNCFLGSSM